MIDKKLKIGTGGGFLSPVIPRKQGVRGGQRTVPCLLLLLLMCVSLLTGCYYADSKADALSNKNFSLEQAALQATADQEDPAIQSMKEDPVWSDAESLKAMVISDLHYTLKQNQDHTLVPGIAEADRITDALLAEVIDRHPDVLIMTGDNTNTGNAEDVSALIAKLQKIKDSGIHLIITTGNHDFDLMDAAKYEAAYFPLLEPVDRDPASLSYTAVIKNTVFLAMDDHDEEVDWQGKFSPETFTWIQDMLEKYKDHTVIFLTHHNVLYGAGEENADTHLILNPELPEILRQGGVELVMSGHMHMQYITEKDDLWEILSGMPFAGRHLIGNLAVSGSRILYYAEPANLARYDPAAKEALDRLDQESSDYMSQIFSEILTDKGLKSYKKKRVMNLIEWFFYYYNAGTLADHRQEFLEDPSYELMLKAIQDTNYGPWVKMMIETTGRQGTVLCLP